MKIKEFAHKHALVFFYTTVVLAIILIVTMIFNICDKGYGFKGKKDMMMRGGYDKGINRGDQMMNRQQRSFDIDSDISPIEENTVSTTSTQ